MKYPRPLVLALGALALLISACSTPDDLTSPTLGPQFGEATPGADYAEHMAANADGVYLGGRWNSRPALIKFGRSGNIPWVSTLPSGTRAEAVAAAPGGVIYVIYSVDAGETRSFSLRKYSNSTVVWTRGLTSGADNFFASAAATDKNGNVYLFTPVGSAGVELRKYWSNGTLAWRKGDTESISDLDVSANGFVHTVSDVGEDYQTLTRYKPDGGLLWRIPLSYANESRRVAVGREGEIYVATNDEEFQFDWLTTLAKYDSRGTRVWMRDVQDNIGLRLDGLDADDQGNVFLGLTNPDFGQQDQPERFKEFYTYSPAGKRLVYRTFDFGTEDPLVGPVALAPTEVYLATSGVGDAEQDGLLLRLNGLTGSVTWRR